MKKELSYKYEIYGRTRRSIGQPDSHWFSYGEGADPKTGTTPFGPMCAPENLAVASDSLKELEESMEKLHAKYSQGMVDLKIVETKTGNTLKEAIFEPSHNCVYETDGGECTVCGKTIVEYLIDKKPNHWKQNK